MLRAVPATMLIAASTLAAFKMCIRDSNRMFLDHFFQNVPNLGIQSLHQLLGIFNILADALGNQLLHNERFEQLNLSLIHI